MNLSITSEQRTLLDKYREEANNYLNDEQTAKNQFKEVVETAAESSGLEKKLVAKLYKAQFNSKVKEILEEADNIRFLTRKDED